MNGGRERTIAEFCVLLNAADFYWLRWIMGALRMLIYSPRHQAVPLFFDFLAPATLQLPVIRCYTSAPSAQSKDNRTFSQVGPPNPTARPRYILTKTQRDYLDRALRVNQAGELAATLIYTAQTPPVVRAHPHLRPLMRHMYDQEVGHFSTFNKLIAKHRIRPTAMYPIWEIAATFLGWSTGIMGREAAMACTEAVEMEIGSHYNEQVRKVLSWVADADKRGEEIDDEIKDLLTILRKTRDEELEHLDHAIENDAKEAQPYELLVNIIRLGCKGAIKISEKI